MNNSWLLLFVALFACTPSNKQECNAETQEKRFMNCYIDAVKCVNYLTPITHGAVNDCIIVMDLCYHGKVEPESQGSWSSETARIE